MFGLFATHVQNFRCHTKKHHWRLRVSCLRSDRDDYTETTNRPSRPDRPQMGDQDDPDYHMETRLKKIKLAA